MDNAVLGGMVGAAIFTAFVTWIFVKDKYEGKLRDLQAKASKVQYNLLLAGNTLSGSWTRNPTANTEFIAAETAKWVAVAGANNTPFTVD